MAFKTPANKLIFVVTNRSGRSFTFNVTTGRKKFFKGYRYTADSRNIPIEKNKAGDNLDINVPHNDVEFWVEK